MELPNSENYIARFERIENVLEFLANGQKQLLTAQVLMTDQVGKIAKAQVQLTDAQAQLAEAQAHSAEALAQLAAEQAKTEVSLRETQDKLNALIHMWDDWIRERRAQGGDGPPVQ